MQRKLHRPVVAALALGLTSLPVAGASLPPQEVAVRPPLQAAVTSALPKGAIPFPAIVDDAKPEPRPLMPAPEALKPAPVLEAPKPQAAPAPAAPPAPQIPAAAPATPAAPPAPVPDKLESLRKAADMLIEVNTALGAPRSPYGQIIYDIAIRHSINPQLVAALIHVESAFNPRAVSRKGARGLMQLLPSTARRFGVNRKRDLFNPKKNLEAGVKYLKWLTDRFAGDAQKILAAYNAGEGAVDRFGGIPPYPETQQYVGRIFGLLGLTLPEPPPVAPAPASVPAAAAPVDAVPAGR